MTTASLEMGARSQRAEGVPSLTGIRAIAAFTIAVGHTYPQLGDVTLIGMPLFFTLSGFIIHYVYSDTFAAGWRPAAVKFAGARFSRIYPLYLALLLVALFATPMGRELYETADVNAALAYVFACWTWLPLLADGKAAQNWYYGISWSVPTEIFFYICYALVFFRFARIRTVKSCLIALIACCVGTYVWFWLLFATRDVWEDFLLRHVSGFPPRTVNFNDSLYRWFLYISPYSRVFEFIGGCLTCQLFLLIRDKNVLTGRMAREFQAWLPSVLIAGTVLVFHVVSQYQNWLKADDLSGASFFMHLHMNFLLAPFCCALIFGLARGGSTLARVLSSGAAVLLGEISYSTYLGHPVAQEVVGNTILGHVRYIGLIEMVAIYLFSWILYTLLEVPAKSALRRLFATRFRVASAAKA